MRTSLSFGAVGLVLLVASMVAAGPPAVEGYSDYRALQGKTRTLAKSKYASYQALAHTLSGRHVGLLTIGTGKVDKKPAILIVSGVDSTRLVDTEVTLRVAQRLVKAAESDAEIRGLIDRVTFYIIAQAAPDGTEAFFDKPLRVRAQNARPIDDDTDGQTDEDGPDDLNGDGLITVMRVEDTSGKYIVHPDDDRVMIEADAKKGEQARYQLLLEGRDDDGDGQLNEDPPGGVNFDRNFPFEYPYFTPGAGPHQVSEIETRAIADFAFDHPNILMVWTLSGRDNLLDTWKPDEEADKKRIKTSLHTHDAPYFDKIAEAYQDICDEDDPPESARGEGAFIEWSYFHYGRWSLATRPWSIPKADEEAEDSEDDEEQEESESEKDDEPDEEKRGHDDRAALAWFEQQGLEGFVDWQAIDHPDLEDKKVEIGGFKPFLRQNPPAELLDDLADDQYDFLLKLSDMLPAIEIANVKAEPLGSNVWRVTVAIVNEGVLPTMSEMGRITRDPQRLQVELTLPKGVSLVTGYGRRTIGPVAGDGGRKEESWLVHDASGKSPILKVRAWSPMVGSVERQVALSKKAE